MYNIGTYLSIININDRRNEAPLLSSLSMIERIGEGFQLNQVGLRLTFVMNLLNPSDGEQFHVFLSVTLTHSHYCRADDGNCYIPYHPYDDRGGKYLSNLQR